MWWSMRRATLVAAAVSLTLTGAPAAAVPPPTAQTATLQAELDELVATTGVPGAQLIHTVDGRVDQFDSGTGDFSTGARFPDGAQVRIASVTKSFVATVVLQLVAEGRVELDGPAQRYLPGVVRGPGGDGTIITVRNLLQHTSGIPNYLPLIDQDSVEGLLAARSPAELIRLGLDRPAEFPPGTEVGYSNTNYLLLGQLIERVTGLPVGVEVTRRILVPLGMFATYWPLYPVEQVIRGPHPRGYHDFGETRVDVTDIDAGWGLADGAMVATGGDLNRFFLALLSGELLPPDLLAQMRTGLPTGLTGYAEAAGLGLFRFSTACGVQAWGHTGAIHGFSTLSVATETRAVTVLMNELPGIAGNIGITIGSDTLLEAVLCMN
ncbi:serine hydrolase domain-containing protein [Nocardia goodfellowii]|uniref:D-alanyl-D-alanine carboxypeptidase n=1 Tax=Nocardia goodfellowii TaxID=882446 RepID=A0ABS4QEW3_9NOCA|nr:serine hydrolase domain-containing protein [Nocardia goodfellowii]MBP2189624.1 D-alanyl-D-alanine carboxypeptidase [Nocardia goodfellowii]